jgi:hypothetical protein
MISQYIVFEKKRFKNVIQSKGIIGYSNHSHMPCFLIS